MKKIFVVCCVLGILLLTTSAKKAGGNNQGFNSDIHGELYVERTAGFSMYIPKDWEIRDMSQKYLMVFGPVDGDFSPNIIFGDEAYSGSLPEYIEAAVSQLSNFYADLEIIENETFTTNTGLQGMYITLLGRINDVQARQRIYLLQNKGATSVMLITGTTLAISGEKYDSLFDECVKTFNWTKK